MTYSTPSTLHLFSAKRNFCNNMECKLRQPRGFDEYCTDAVYKKVPKFFLQNILLGSNINPCGGKRILAAVIRVALSSRDLKLNLCWRPR